MAPSSSSSALRSIYRNRRSCIKKKTEELAILCDVEAFAIIMGPDGSDLMTWPKNHSQLKSVIAKYRNHSGGNQAKKNPEKKKKKWVLSDWNDSWLDGLGGDSLLDFSNSVRVKIEQVKKRAEVLKSVDREKIQQTNPNDQLFVNAMEIHAEIEPLFNQTVMFGNGENGGFTFTQQQANPNDWVNFLQNGETNPSFSWIDLAVNGEETPNCWVSGEEIGQLWVDLVNGTETEQFPQTNTSCCVDNMGSFQTVPNCGFSDGGEYSNLEAQVNNFDYGCNNITGQQYSSSSGYDYGMYDYQHPAMGSFLPQYDYGRFVDGGGSSSSVWL